MTARRIARRACAILLASVAAALGAESVSETNAVAVLELKTGFWRVHITSRTPELIDAAGTIKPLLAGRTSPNPVPVTCSGYPDRNWMAPDLDDTSWPRRRGTIGPLQGYGQTLASPVSGTEWGDLWNSPSPAWTRLICARSKFRVDDPAAAKGLKVSVSYYGGAVVYVNGRELARAHLPVGDLTFDTLAARYPQDAYLRPDGKQLSPGNDAQSGFDSKEFADRFGLRVRRLEAEIPVEFLRKGVNVMAVGVYRAPYDEAAVTAPFSKSSYRGPWGPWAHARLLQMCVTAPSGLTAVVPNTGRPAGVQFWTAHACEPVSTDAYADPFEQPQPVRLAGFRGGTFSAQVVVSSATPLSGLKVSVGELVDVKSGTRLPASALSLRYPLWERDRVEALAEQAPADGRVKTQPVWVSVRVPADAKPGLYEGRVSVQAQGLPASEVPLSLRVSDWQFPDAKDFLTHNQIWQCTEAEALVYGVPVWSDRHFELIGRSLELTRPLANKFCQTHLIAHAEEIGNSQGMVYWIDKGDGKYAYDFGVFDRYLDLYQAKVGKPGILLIDVWKWAADRDKAAPGGFKVSGTNSVRVSRIDPQTRKVDEIIPPLYGTPESVAFWKPVLDEVRKRLEKRGWMDVACLGTASDDVPRPPTLAAFQEIWPDVSWFCTGHMCPARFPAGKGGFVPVRSVEWVWGCGRLWDPAPNKEYPRPWKTAPARYSIAFPREGATAAMLKQEFSTWDYRWNAEKVLQCNLAGIGRVCMDCWPIPGRRGLLCGSPGQYNFCASITALFHPGPDGAVPTVRSEMYREGVQVREAMSFLMKAVDAKRMDGALAARCTELLAERARNVLAPTGPRNWMEQEGRLYDLCAEVAASGE